MSAEAILARLQAMEVRVAELEATDPAAEQDPEVGHRPSSAVTEAVEAAAQTQPATNFHHGFDSRPPPKSHATDLVTPAMGSTVNQKKRVS